MVLTPKDTAPLIEEVAENPLVETEEESENVAESSLLCKVDKVDVASVALEMLLSSNVVVLLTKDETDEVLSCVKDGREEVVR